MLSELLGGTTVKQICGVFATARSSSTNEVEQVMRAFQGLVLTRPHPCMYTQ